MMHTPLMRTTLTTKSSRRMVKAWNLNIQAIRAHYFLLECIPFKKRLHAQNPPPPTHPHEKNNKKKQQKNRKFQKLSLLVEMANFFFQVYPVALNSGLHFMDQTCFFMLMH